MDGASFLEYLGQTHGIVSMKGRSQHVEITLLDGSVVKVERRKVKELRSADDALRHIAKLKSAAE